MQDFNIERVFLSSTIQPKLIEGLEVVVLSPSLSYSTPYLFKKVKGISLWLEVTRV